MQNRTQYVLEKLTEELTEQLHAKYMYLLSALAGAGVGYQIQQSRTNLPEQLGYGAISNLAFLIVQGMVNITTTAGQENYGDTKTDLRYLSSFDVGGLIGYGIGVFKDLTSHISN